ncbi:FAD assembly factor SdhE [Terrihabitans sp. B22-R8]|uniref:FAD assembly factor SdhE n=1 Tax=Terrihabitans sp. B22-R8 TaxID=3425128 RepID=UPI00403D0717
MTGTTANHPELDPRRRRALFRAWHRGTREMDFILGRFADAKIHGMSDADLDRFEHLLEALDADLLGWISGGREVPAEYRSALFERILAFHGLPRG